MTDPNNPLNLTEFDLESYEIAIERLNLPNDEAFEVSVEVAKQENSEFIGIDDINWNGEEDEQ
jgi:hypothetical protein